MLSRLLLRRAALDCGEVPLLGRLLHAGGAGQAPERVWMLHLLALGLRVSGGERMRGGGGQIVCDIALGAVSEGRAGGREGGREKGGGGRGKGLRLMWCSSPDAADECPGVRGGAGVLCAGCEHCRRPGLHTSVQQP
jgi:hypothetical protein